MSTDRLVETRAQIEAGRFRLTPDAQRAVLSRVDDLITAVGDADRALARHPQPAVGEAAAKTAYVYYLSGHGWKRFLSGDDTVGAADAIQSAVSDSISLILPQLEHALSARTTSIVKRSESSWSLTCSACGGDAVSFTKSRTGPESPEQLVVSSLSPVTVFRPVAGPRMLDLIALLNAGNAADVVQYMKETQPAGCDACCPVCNRVYCREHTAVEAQWSGSWHEATYATCPLGHEREIE